MSPVFSVRVLAAHLNGHALTLELSLQLDERLRSDENWSMSTVMLFHLNLIP